LTLDHDFLQHNLERLTIGLIDENRTAIGSALMAALNRLEGLKDKSKIVILMTDGENNSGKISPMTAAETAKSLGVKVYTIGIGIRGKAPYPVIDQFGQKHYQWMDVDVDEDTLTKMAEMTGGKYYRADSAEIFHRIYSEIDRLEKSEVEVKKYQHFDELFPPVTIAGLGAFLLEMILGHTVWRKLP
jgi:Ca-activated chloride channel family protein